MRPRSRLLCLALLPCLLPGCIAVIGQRYRDRPESKPDTEMDFQFLTVDELDDDDMFGNTWREAELDSLEQRIAILEQQLKSGASAPSAAR